jgi:RNA polymerase sigma factor (sigma-70 family)
VCVVSESETFVSLLARLRAGDEAAARELLERYEAVVRREVRLGLRDRRLGRLYESADVAQSVFATFFVRAAAGEYDLGTPADLIRLLVAVTRNKVASAARKAYADRRDVRREAASDTGQFDRLASDEQSPSQQVAAADLLNNVLAQLSADERVLVSLRAEGLGWDEVAARVGGTAQARRVQLARALSRVCRMVGLDDEADIE